MSDVLKYMHCHQTKECLADYCRCCCSRCTGLRSNVTTPIPFKELNRLKGEIESLNKSLASMTQRINFLKRLDNQAESRIACLEMETAKQFQESIEQAQLIDRLRDELKSKEDDNE